MKEKCLRAITSTRYSITVAWDTTSDADDKRTGSSLSNRSSKTAEEDSLPTSFEDGEKSLYVLQMKDRIIGWKTVYSGFKTRTEVKCLKPGECFQFRVKKLSEGEETEWSDTLYAATKDEAIPLGQLFRAVQNSNAITTKKIIAQRPSLLNTPNKFSQSPLELAISNNDVNMVTVLLSNGADVNRPEIGSWRTPLMIAAFRGHLDIVKILSEKGCCWEDRDRKGMTALHYAADNSHLDIVKFAVEEGADVTAKDVFGWSPLMRAVTLKASTKVVEYLLENGGDPDETDGRKQTLLMQAVQSGRPEIVRLILSKNADISRENVYGHKAADFAVNSPVKEIRKMGEVLGSEEEKERNDKKCWRKRR